MRKIVYILLLGCFFITSILGPNPVYAQEFNLPTPGVLVHLSPEFNPPILKGIKVHPDNPFHFEFILDQGVQKVGPPTGHSQEARTSTTFFKEESSKLIKYFLASLTIPDKDLWVNLSPYEKNRIIPQSFGLTEMGRDLLAEDYMLKQITASLIYPEEQIGKKFWTRVYQEAAQKFGTTNIPVNTFNKVWIVPEKAVVYENIKAGAAYIVESKLKVMLEEDYLALERNSRQPWDSSVKATQGNDVNALGSQIVREIVIPELDREVNEGKNFAPLRQVYNSLILATWYKKKIKDSILAQVYSDKNKTTGVSYQGTINTTLIYQRYLQAFKKGVYNYIKEEPDFLSNQIIPRKYFSGGVPFFKVTDVFQARENANSIPERQSYPAQIIDVMLDQAMSTGAERSTDVDAPELLTLFPTLSAAEEFSFVLWSAVAEGRLDNGMDWHTVRLKIKENSIFRWLDSPGVIDQSLYRRAQWLLEDADFIEEVGPNGQLIFKKDILTVDKREILKRIQKAYKDYVYKTMQANTLDPISAEEDLGFALWSALAKGKIESIKIPGHENGIGKMKLAWRDKPGRINKGLYQRAFNLLISSDLITADGKIKEVEAADQVRKLLKKTRQDYLAKANEMIRGNVSKGVADQMELVVNSIRKQTKRVNFPTGFWKKETNALEAIWWALDQIPGFQKARQEADIKTMADLYRQHVLAYKYDDANVVPRGQQGYFFQEGLKGLMGTSSLFLDKQSSPAALLRFALPGLIDEDAAGALRPWEVEDVWNDERLAKKAYLQALDEIPGFNIALRNNHVKAMAYFYRKYVLSYDPKDKAYPKGQTGYFYKVGKLEGLMGHPRSFLDKQNSPAALLRCFLPGLIDEDAPGALRPWELEDSWNDERLAKKAGLQALDGMADAFYHFRITNNVKEMVALYREKVLAYPGGQLNYFAKYTLTSLMGDPRPFLDKTNSVAALLRFILPILLKQPDGLRLEEIERESELGNRAMRIDKDSQEFDWPMLEGEGYSIKSYSDKTNPEAPERVLFILSRNSQPVKDSQIVLEIFPQQRLVYIKYFSPNFPKDRRGRGRALLRRILDSVLYGGYHIMTNASSPFVKSLQNMKDFQIEEKKGLFRIEIRQGLNRSAGDLTPRQQKELGRIIRVSNIHGIVPNRAMNADSLPDKKNQFVANEAIHEFHDQLVGRGLDIYNLFPTAKGIYLASNEDNFLGLVEAMGLSPASPTRVLDLGSGNGLLLMTLKKFFPNIHAVGIEYDEGLLERARRASFDLLGKNAIDYQQGDFNDQHFEGLIKSSDVLYYFRHGTRQEDLLTKTLRSNLSIGSRLVVLENADDKSLDLGKDFQMSMHPLSVHSRATIYQRFKNQYLQVSKLNAGMIFLGADFGKRMFFDITHKRLLIDGQEVNLIGQGGRNIIYNSFNHIAFRVYHVPSEISPGEREGFEATASLKAGLKIIGEGFTSNGYYFLAVEQINGDSLDHLSHLEPKQWKQFKEMWKELIGKMYFMEDPKPQQFMYGSTQRVKQKQWWVADAEMIKHRPDLTRNQLIDLYIKKFHEHSLAFPEDWKDVRIKDRLIKYLESLKENDTGGIDFTNKTPLEIQNAGEGIKFHLDPAILVRLQNAPGFVPVIINVKPLTNLRAFLGINDPSGH